MQPKVTIVTVCYNADKEIETTLLSVLSQKYNNLEYIVIDGDSSDNTMDIINKYKDKITRILSEPDKGIFDAMNKGINMASGNWILFLNAGDTFCNETVVERMVFETPIDAGVIYGNAMFVKNGIKRKYSPLPFFNSKERYPDMGICHQSIFVRTDIAKNLLFDLSYQLSADYDMIMKIYNNNYKFYYKDVMVCNYDLSGVSSLNYLRKIKEKMRIYRNPINIDSMLLYIKALYVQLKIFIKQRL